MDNHQETEYVLNNPILMKQIEQFRHRSKVDANHSIDFGYILSNPELIPQIQLLIETHQT
jgi:hypothetical protein